ncbi:C-22 sterol desaturase Erg5 [Planoprotostelium fungivorum]|uniref:sterol 22-desaturase n=1 Tax=Planoprotostelium fungivorum TaxID=1890364 RepID=A0A2P6P0F3_9EUKA|nr:C-22 sterol desaturase Erg5 [Planoprotostelium fungivorum]
MSSLSPLPQTLNNLIRPVQNALLSIPFVSERPKLALAASIVAGLLALEQISYRRKKKDLPGPTWKIPIIGAFLDSLYPTFDGYLAKWYSGPLSCVAVFDRFIVIASGNETSRKILSSPEFAEPALIDSMRKILCNDNWVFLSGKAHTEYRKQLNVLFTRRAMATYLPIQQRVNAKHFDLWLSVGAKAQPFQLFFRELNMESSLRVFMGDYITDEVATRISEEYFRITAALELVNFPIALPGTKVWYAMRARQYIVDEFMKCIPVSRKRMAAGEPVTCMLDSWTKHMMEKRGEQGEEVRVFNDREITLTILTFLFASQDATSSAMTWAFQLLADHPDVLQRVRDEQMAVRNGDLNATVDFEVVEKMVYTRQTVKEILRYRPPVLMVPYQAKKSWDLSPDYTVPSGSMLIPTIWPSLHDPQVYPEPDKFNPDRWGPSGTAEKHPKNFMVFGSGTHYCLGKEYVVMHLMNVIGTASLLMDWKHHATPDSEKIVIFATTYPQDQCVCEFTPRVAAQ